MASETNTTEETPTYYSTAEETTYFPQHATDTVNQRGADDTKLTAYMSHLRFDKILGIEDVASTLRNVDAALIGSRLEPLRNFNTTYLIITEHVERAMRQGNFQNSGFLTAFDAQFAKYYLSALREHLAGNHTPPAWNVTFESARNKSASPLIIMALGVNAHVNNDIPWVLEDCGASLTHQRDYYLVNQIISESIDEVIQNLQSYRSLLHPSRILLRPLYKQLMKVLIQLWRYRAWCKFRAVQSHAVTVRRIESQAYTISRGVRLLPL